MQKTNIEWTDRTWNPIKGLCPTGCFYCYARKMYNSKFYSKPPFNDLNIRGPFLDDRDFYKIRNKPSKIFVCSTFEIFHPVILTATRNLIFKVIKENPQHTFQILTKMPENIDRPMPDNVWLGVSVTKGNDEGWDRMYYLNEAKAKLKFISFEPLLGMINTSMIINSLEFDWFIFGGLTGHGKKYGPDIRWIAPMVDYFRGYKKPTFLKNNLKDIWGEDLIQEFPE